MHPRALFHASRVCTLGCAPCIQRGFIDFHRDTTRAPLHLFPSFLAANRCTHTVPAAAAPPSPEPPPPPLRPSRRICRRGGHGRGVIPQMNFSSHLGSLLKQPFVRSRRPRSCLRSADSCCLSLHLIFNIMCFNFRV